MKQPYFVNDILDLVEGRMIQKSTNNLEIKTILIDSRRVSDPDHSVFIAVRGDRNNGHEFISEAYQKGVRTFIISEDINLSSVNNSWVIKVPNTLSCLQLMAHKHLKKFHFPVVGVTGSNGKTIVKEWLYQLLKDEFHIVKSPKSYNSQVGVPLSVWQCNQEHNFGIFEAGVSKPGEMGALEFIIQPTIGIFTNLGGAHDENFKNWEEKAKEKLRLFENSKVLIYCRDFLPIHNLITQKSHFKELKTFTWSKKLQADLMIGKISKTDVDSTIQGVYQNQFIKIKVPFNDDASIENCINCWATLLFLGYDSEWVNKRVKFLSPVAMRLELKEGLNNCSIINDYYNSDFSSLEIAIDFMLQQKQHPDKTIILSDILQSGKKDQELYQSVADLLERKGIRKIIGVGKNISSQKDLFPASAKFYITTNDFIQGIDLSSFKNETILLKGARPFGFERISTLFQKRVHETELEINLNSLINNLNYFKSKVLPKTKIMAMVKAFSYGSGSYEIANVLQYNLVDYLAVAYADEGVELRRAGITAPIMVMNPEQQSYDLMIQNRLEPEIYSFKVLDLFIKSLKRSGYKNPLGYSVHIKLDTGMHRLGFEECDLHKLIIKLKNYKSIRVKSVFSHLSTADDPIHKLFTKDQIELFNRLSSMICDNLGGGIIKHIVNSAGTLAFPEAHFDMVRLGIGLYGVTAYPEHQEKLEPVSQLKTTISQIKKVPAHDSIGYSRMEMPTKEITIATVPIGYADGLRRSLGRRKGYMLIDGQKASIVGNVCMDMCMLDITHIDAEEGDEVIVFGKSLTIQKFAKLMDTIPYEALTGISSRVKRVYYQE